MKVLFIGDIMGRPGRSVIKGLLEKVTYEHGVEFIIANGENTAGGKGITREVARELFASGIDVLTGGNHTWQNREVYHIIDEDKRILRPANYPQMAEVPGHGTGVFETSSGVIVGVINLQGRIFMPPIDCPFQKAREVAPRLRDITKVLIVDFHAEATSEKVAMGWFLDGQVSAVLGTHTHVQTADERILPGGTAYLTDAGMTGSHDGVIGVKRDIVLDGMLTRLPVRHKLSTGDLELNAVLIEIDDNSGKALSIQRIHQKLGQS